MLHTLYKGERAGDVDNSSFSFTCRTMTLTGLRSIKLTLDNKSIIRNKHYPVVLTRLPYYALLGLTRPYWALLGLTRPYRALLGLTRPY